MPQKPITFEAGVSEELARHRRQVLTDIRYQISLDIPRESEADIAAQETITFRWIRNTLDLLLDFKEAPENVKSIAVNGRTLSVVLEKEHLIIPASALKNGPNKVDINFVAGNLSLNRNEEYLYTLLVPDRARTVFPCFDQPDLKATFALSLTVPKDWVAVSNGPFSPGWAVYPPFSSLPDSVVESILSRKTYDFKPTNLLPTYLFSFVAGKFETVTRTVGGREMNFYHRETDTSKIRLSLDPIFETHSRALNFLEDYTQIKYPFQKFDFAAIPDFQYGGMEHAGAIQYKASSLFLDKGATQNQKTGRVKLLAHETAHMWFGDLVTMRWFNDVWMKEVFANFMADKIAEATQPESNYALEFLIAHFPAAYGVDRTEGPNAIGQQLENLNQAGTMYGPIIYHKAPIMMRQLERLMGKDALRDGLREYLKTYAYGNATWAELVAILDKYTPADLLAWNKVWVNATGRPRFEYDFALDAEGKYTRFVIRQESEDEVERIWPQSFEIALVYPNRAEEVTINMNADSVIVPELVGKAIPDYVLFNSSGQGYGLFPVQAGKMLRQLANLPDPLMRTSAYVNLYENMLNQNEAVRPAILADLLARMLSIETDELSLGLIAGQQSEIFWQFMTPDQRTEWGTYLEEKTWETMVQEPTPNKKKVLFKLYQNIALTLEAQDRLYRIWQDEAAPTGVTLTEDDYTALALSLALRDYPEVNLLDEQLTRIKNPDRRKRLEFMRPALSGDVAVRDAFFASLKEEKNRAQESWVAAALGYLHHPLRAATSGKYLPASLALLEEIQRTGDIFFPSAWLSATLGAYQSAQAAQVVRDFLDANPNYNPRLKAKLLQAADGLFRAERILHEK